MQVYFFSTDDNWSEADIECLCEGLRKFGRRWGRVSSLSGVRKTGKQCRKFFETHCTSEHEKLGLLKALAEHSYTIVSYTDTHKLKAVFSEKV